MPAAKIRPAEGEKDFVVGRERHARALPRESLETRCASIGAVSCRGSMRRLLGICSIDRSSSSPELLLVGKRVEGAPVKGRGESSITCVNAASTYLCWSLWLGNQTYMGLPRARWQRAPELAPSKASPNSRYESLKGDYMSVL